MTQFFLCVACATKLLFDTHLRASSFLIFFISRYRHHRWLALSLPWIIIKIIMEHSKRKFSHHIRSFYHTHTYNIHVSLFTHLMAFFAYFFGVSQMVSFTLSRTLPSLSMMSSRMRTHIIIRKMWKHRLNKRKCIDIDRYAECA